MEYLKTIGISCAAIAIYHLVASRYNRQCTMNKFDILLGIVHRLIRQLERENRDISRILRDNIRPQSYILDIIEDLEDDETDSENSDDENVILPKSNATNEV